MAESGRQGASAARADGNFFDRLHYTGATAKSDEIRSCFDAFDTNRDGLLDFSEFSHMIQCLFTYRGTHYDVSEQDMRGMLDSLDENEDGMINLAEFTTCWKHWFSQILRPKSALLVVDVQNDFIDGSLALRNGESGHEGSEVVPVINELQRKVQFDMVAYTLDWHPEEHVSFFDNVRLRPMHATSKVTHDDACLFGTAVFSHNSAPVEQTLWPVHCVQNQWGSELHPKLEQLPGAVYVRKGTHGDIDSYSAFWDNCKLSQTDLAKKLADQRITDVYVCGLAFDFCVGGTALHSVEHGFRTILIEDGCRAVSHAGMDEMRSRLLQQGAVIVNSSSVKDMVDGVDRRPELGRQAALNVAVAREMFAKEQKKKSVDFSP